MRGKRNGGYGKARDSQGDSHRGKCNSGRRIAGDANMSVWNFGRKTRSAVNGEDLPLAILRGSKPRETEGAFARGDAVHSCFRQIDDLILNDAP